jgi:ribosomal protein S18 acetylase RimI-like enzyme
MSQPEESHDPAMQDEVTYRTDLEGVDWVQLKATLAADQFDNGRTPEQLQESFENSGATVLAWAGGQVVGTVRALSDGVCNAYVVDVWTYSPFRRRGIARTMMELLLSSLEGQHVYLFTDDAAEFYRKLGFREQPVGMGRVVGEWLKQSC